jgi:photosystem II stability/assembly factor-like uncharacterized protein
MRFGLAILIAVLAAPHAAATTEYHFSWAHPRPQGNSLGGAAFEDDLVGYAVGDRGAVVKTTDGGASWNLVSSFPEFAVDLEDLLVTGPGELLAVGDPPGIFRSVNGGATWTAVPNPSTGRLRDIEVVTGTILSAVGDGGQVVRSLDGGLNWTLVGSAGSTIKEQLWLDASNGYALGLHLARRTTDGGATWSPIPGISEQSFESFNEAFATDSQHIFILSDFHLWKSVNGGASWSGSFLPGSFAYAGNTVVLGPQHFIVVTNLEGAFIFETVNGGDSWTRILNSTAPGFLDFDRLPSGTLIAVADNGDIYRSLDDGAHWSNAIDAIPSRRQRLGGLAVGPGLRGAAGTTGSPGQQSFKTEDGGATWSLNSAGPLISFTSDAGYWDSDRAILAGDTGKIWATTNGGATWIAAALPGAPTNGAAWHLSLPAPGIAYAVVTGSNQSLVYRTVDYGASWEQRSTGIPISGGLTGVSFPSATRGYAVGYTTGGVGRMFTTADGGASWTPVTTSGLPSSRWPADVHFHSDLEGLVTVDASPGGIYRTTNGGATWVNVEAVQARELSFSDSLHGVAGSGSFNGSGTVFVTEDGGASWQSLLLPATGAGNVVAAVSDGFFAGGDAGVIVKATRFDTSADGDGDGFPSAGDCDDANDQVWSPPGEVIQLEFADATTLTWAAPNDLGGTLGATRFDTLRSTGPGSFDVAPPAVCLDPADVDLLTTDAEIPPPDGIFFYLVRARNACSAGSLGASSTGSPRTGIACSSSPIPVRSPAGSESSHARPRDTRPRRGTGSSSGTERTTMPPATAMAI